MTEGHVFTGLCLFRWVAPHVHPIILSLVPWPSRDTPVTGPRSLPRGVPQSQAGVPQSWLELPPPGVSPSQVRMGFSPLPSQEDWLVSRRITVLLNLRTKQEGKTKLINKTAKSYPDEIHQE